MKCSILFTVLFIVGCGGKHREEDLPTKQPEPTQAKQQEPPRDPVKPEPKRNDPPKQAEPVKPTGIQLEATDIPLNYGNDQTAYYKFIRDKYEGKQVWFSGVLLGGVEHAERKTHMFQVQATFFTGGGDLDLHPNKTRVVCFFLNNMSSRPLYDEWIKARDLKQTIEVTVEGKFIGYYSTFPTAINPILENTRILSKRYQ